MTPLQIIIISVLTTILTNMVLILIFSEKLEKNKPIKEFRDSYVTCKATGYLLEKNKAKKVVTEYIGEFYFTQTQIDYYHPDHAPSYDRVEKYMYGYISTKYYKSNVEVTEKGKLVK